LARAATTLRAKWASAFAVGSGRPSFWRQAAVATSRWL